MSVQPGYKSVCLEWKYEEGEKDNIVGIMK